jgi:hypothetical protein
VESALRAIPAALRMTLGWSGEDRWVRRTSFVGRFAAIAEILRVFGLLLLLAWLAGILLAESACGYPVVHHPSVTLSNHTILETEPYNEPCPKDHF